MLRSKQKTDGRVYPGKVPEICVDGTYKKNKEWSSELGFFNHKGDSARAGVIRQGF
jgi:hypothetical protein